MVSDCGFVVGKGDLITEIVMVAGQRFEFVPVAQLTQASRAVPEADPAPALPTHQHIEDHGSHRCDARAAADEDHFTLGIAGMKRPERSR